MLQDIKELVQNYQIDLKALELTSLKYSRAGERFKQFYVQGQFDRLLYVRRDLKRIIAKNEGDDESIEK